LPTGTRPQAPANASSCSRITSAAVETGPKL
jgi:hypothetical protein